MSTYRELVPTDPSNAFDDTDDTNGDSNDDNYEDEVIEYNFATAAPWYGSNTSDPEHSVNYATEPADRDPVLSLPESRADLESRLGMSVQQRGKYVVAQTIDARTPRPADIVPPPVALTHMGVSRTGDTIPADGILINSVDEKRRINIRHNGPRDGRYDSRYREEYLKPVRKSRDLIARTLPQITQCLIDSALGTTAIRYNRDGEEVGVYDTLPDCKVGLALLDRIMGKPTERKEITKEETVTKATVQVFIPHNFRDTREDLVERDTQYTVADSSGTAAKGAIVVA